MNLMIVTDRYVKRENTTNFINCHLLQLLHIIYRHAYLVKLCKMYLWQSYHNFSLCPVFKDIVVTDKRDRVDEREGTGESSSFRLSCWLIRAKIAIQIWICIVYWEFVSNWPQKKIVSMSENDKIIREISRFQLLFTNQFGINPTDWVIWKSPIKLSFKLNSSLPKPLSRMGTWSYF